MEINEVFREAFQSAGCDGMEGSSLGSRIGMHSWVSDSQWLSVDRVEKVLLIVEWRRKGGRLPLCVLADVIAVEKIKKQERRLRITCDRDVEKPWNWIYSFKYTFQD